MKKKQNYGFFLFVILILTGCTKDNLAPCFTTTKTTFETGEAVNFTNCTVNGEKYRWLFGDGSTSDVTSPSHTFTKAGTYFVRLSVVSPMNNTLQSVFPYTNMITIVNPSAKFANLNSGKKVTNATVRIISQGRDSVGVDSSFNESFSVKTFEESPKLVRLEIPLYGFPMFGMSIKHDRLTELTNNSITVPDTSIYVKDFIAQGYNVKASLSGFKANYNNGQVTIEYTSSIEADANGILAEKKSEKYSYTFNK